MGSAAFLINAALNSGARTSVAARLSKKWQELKLVAARHSQSEIVDSRDHLPSASMALRSSSIVCAQPFQCALAAYVRYFPRRVRLFLSPKLRRALLRVSFRTPKTAQPSRPASSGSPRHLCNYLPTRLNAGIGRTPEKVSIRPYDGVRGRGYNHSRVPNADDRTSEKR